MLSLLAICFHSFATIEPDACRPCRDVAKDINWGKVVNAI